MMYQGWKAQSEKRAEQIEPKRVTLRWGGGREDASRVVKHGWLDSMLGAGSRKAVTQAFTKGEPRRSSRPPATLRMQALRSNDDVTQPASRRGKGLIRLMTLAILFSWVMAQTKPWKHLPSMALTSKAGNLKSHAPVPMKEVLPQGPVVDAKGKSLALWRGESSGWYLVNAAGQLRRATDMEAASRIDLPQLTGVKSKFVETGSSRPAARMLMLDTQPGLLAQLLPLSSEIAPEISWVILGLGGEVSLRTQSGAEIRLGTDDFKAKEARLSAVLADLAARHKRAASVDLRFKDSAVVRLASR